LAASRRTRYLAEQALLRFFERHSTAYYWTFTFAENQQDKDTVEACLKPLRDMISRRGGEELHFWEIQKRGAYHVHIVTDVYLPVVELRPWMVARGWGPIMRVERVRLTSETLADDFSGRSRGWSRERLVRYLLKYLTKALDEGFTWKKQFGGSARAKVGTTQFKWAPWIVAHSMLFAAGLDIWMATQPEPHWPRSHEIANVIRTGYYASGWHNVDPWFT
jgi:hypothetical protein